MPHHVLLAIQEELKLAVLLLLLFGRDRLQGKILTNVWQELGNFKVLKRCYNQIYPTNFLLCYEKAIDLQLIYSLDWSNVEFS